MSYSFQVYVSAQASDDPAALAALLREVNADATVVETARGAKLSVGSWSLSCEVCEDDFVAEEAKEIAQRWAKDPRIKAHVAASRRRIEVETFPEHDTDDHYNTWLITQERLANQPGMVVFSPAEAEFSG